MTTAACVAQSATAQIRGLDTQGIELVALICASENAGIAVASSLHTNGKINLKIIVALCLR